MQAQRYWRVAGPQHVSARGTAGAATSSHWGSVTLHRVELGDQPAAVDLVQRHPHTGRGVRRRVLADDHRLVDEHQHHGVSGLADTDATAGTVATARSRFCLAPGITTSLVSEVWSPGNLRSTSQRAAPSCCSTVSGLYDSSAMVLSLLACMTRTHARVVGRRAPNCPSTSGTPRPAPAAARQRGQHTAGEHSRPIGSSAWASLRLQRTRVGVSVGGFGWLVGLFGVIGLGRPSAPSSTCSVSVSAGASVVVLCGLVLTVLAHGTNSTLDTLASSPQPSAPRCASATARGACSGGTGVGRLDRHRDQHLSAVVVTRTPARASAMVPTDLDCAPA